MRSLLAILFFASCAGLNRPDPKTTHPEVGAGYEGKIKSTLRVVTFNVHGEPSHRLARVFTSAPTLRGADVILLQEMEHHGAQSTSKSLAKSLGMNYVYAPGYGLGDGGSHGVALLSRHPLRDIEVIELPRYHVVFNSARRVAIGATSDALGTPIRLYAVHLDNRINPAARQQQLAPVISNMQQYGLPTIIGGDLNTSPFCWGAHVFPLPCGLQTKRLENYVRRYGLSTPTRTAGATSQWLNMRLDGIYTKGLTSKAGAVERRVRISDHLPLWLDVSLPTHVGAARRRP